MPLRNKARYVYVDYTNDGRPFYVGQGTSHRVKCFKRNPRHAAIIKMHGIHREVVFITSIEQLAHNVEVELIAELKTRHGLQGHWGANLTDGGEGITNVDAESRAKMSAARKRRDPPSKETRRRIGEATTRSHTGRRRSEETKRKLSIAASERRYSDEYKQRMSEIKKGHKHSPETKAKIATSCKLARARMPAQPSNATPTSPQE